MTPSRQVGNLLQPGLSSAYGISIYTLRRGQHLHNAVHAHLGQQGAHGGLDERAVERPRRRGQEAEQSLQLGKQQTVQVARGEPTNILPLKT